jgi:hypothetical protein
MTINLEKKIERGSWRWIGQRVRGISTLDVPIGASNIRSIIRHSGGTPYRIGRIDPRNAVVIDRDPLRLLYVRPGYSGYRFAASKVFPSPLWAVDYDHALARQIALRLGFSYVLLIRLTPRANRSHGSYEKAEPLTGLNLRKLCFADRRIIGKWLGRRPGEMGDPAGLAPYKLRIEQAFGLSLKQAGFWGYAMGVEDEPLLLGALRPLR